MPEHSKAILAAARKLIGTPYASLDCSHFVHKAFADAGLEYTYASTASFSTIPQFQPVATPQEGDVVLFSSHMGIYDPNGCAVVDTAECKRLGATLPILSARSGNNLGVEYGRASWFAGQAKYFRWKD